MAHHLPVSRHSIINRRTSSNHPIKAVHHTISNKTDGKAEAVVEAEAGLSLVAISNSNSIIVVVSLGISVPHRLYRSDRKDFLCGPMVLLTMHASPYCVARGLRALTMAAMS